MYQLEHELSGRVVSVRRSPCQVVEDDVERSVAAGPAGRRHLEEVSPRQPATEGGTHQPRHFRLARRLHGPEA